MIKSVPFRTTGDQSRVIGTSSQVMLSSSRAIMFQKLRPPKTFNSFNNTSLTSPISLSAIYHGNLGFNRLSPTPVPREFISGNKILQKSQLSKYIVKAASSSDSSKELNAVSDEKSSLNETDATADPSQIKTELGSRDNSVPTKQVLKTWRNVDAVCFDVDCTITVNDSLDLLAEFMGVKNEVTELTNKAMDGSLSLSRALEERLRLIDCTPADIRRFLKVHPPESRLAPGIQRLISALKQRGVAIYLISGGFRELTLPIAEYLGIPRDHVFANRMNWQWDDETGEPSRLVGFDLNEPTAHNRGKPQAIARIRQRNPYNTVVMVGDGITDLEAVQKSSGADLFIGYGGVIVRPAVAQAADWYVRDYEALISKLPRYKVTMLGSGAWACAVARMVAQNTLTHDIFDPKVRMWVYEEEVEIAADGSLILYPGIEKRGGGEEKKGDEKKGDKEGTKAEEGGNIASAATSSSETSSASSPSTTPTPTPAPTKQTKKLTELINERHENPKYLPNISLGSNVLAVPDLGDAVRDADIVLLCVPHQFMHGICRKLEGKLKAGAFALSLTKGMRVRRDGLQLISQMVSRHTSMDCAVLMGANIAADIGKEELSEAVIGFTNPDHARILKRLIERPYFRISLIADPVGAEMCGTLKNIVAVAAGIVDGLGLGPNSKAAVMRQGLSEMRRFAKSLYPSVRDGTFLESCGVADLIATCYGGRNRAVSEAWTKAQLSDRPRSFESLETELLKGQKLQGVLTSSEVQEIIHANEWEEDYPLFTTVNRIITGRLHPEMVTRFELGCLPLDATSAEVDDQDLTHHGGGGGGGNGALTYIPSSSASNGKKDDGAKSRFSNHQLTLASLKSLQKRMDSHSHDHVPPKRFVMSRKQSGRGGGDGERGVHRVSGEVRKGAGNTEVSEW
nr:glycerol-3-phosphate dehydrogenase (NAD+) (GPDA) [Polytomella parva]|mmetsp:Transcript_8516/g.16298  ORF Transcript_8516/g.16298 Transcript_8516/m.16298 type:complete len:909 (-) Transcript_8516:360-3086(-)|eukprot:CAMPEP_0175074954 /NCGR_PEP_ID=MMETSP0052_2-20121109/21661_1 /TAXON_ID=51329 ORGANISM="Polytomella parva, Strain SAG 63-3" /NCGR_SAMPLE_ID=MMETSP0052_2 /ASSEMBLY_ACC=CAM_ASM_000194 /LENGTH=908 /DNA_ID=CAMNT_0016343445 /DNA_START=119 /DNA_END=2845 /DNA_ORIENTATION=-